MMMTRITRIMKNIYFLRTVIVSFVGALIFYNMGYGIAKLSSDNKARNYCEPTDKVGFSKVFKTGST